MNIVITPEAIIVASVLLSALAWAVIASIMAYNSGTAYNEIAERHNSVVDTLRKTELELSSLRDSTSKAFQKHRMEIEEVNRDVLMGLKRIDQLTADRERFQALYTEASNKLNKYHRPRDPKTGRIVKAPKPTPEKSEGLAAFTEMMDNAIDQIKGLTVRTICDEVKSNAVNDVR